MGFDDRTLMQDAQMEDTLYKNPGSNILLDDDTLNKEGENDNVEKPMDIDFDAAAAPRNDFGDDLDDFGMIISVETQDFGPLIRAR